MYMKVIMTLFTSDVQDNHDPIYRHLATLEQYANKIPEIMLQEKIILREKVCALWDKYGDRLDRNKSRQEIKTHFNSVYWELYLCKVLSSIGFNLNDRKQIGPDFNCVYQGLPEEFYFEAISVKSGEGNNSSEMKCTKISELKDDEEIPVYNYSADLLKLRITQGIQEKSNKFRTYIDNGIISDTSFPIIAIHYPNELGFLSGVSGLTIFHESVFPLGPVIVTFDTKTYKPIQTSNLYSPVISKHTGAEIPTTFFLSDTSSNISGLLFSNISYTADKEEACSVGFIHNPFAKNPIQTGLFKNTEYGEWKAAISENEQLQILQI